MLNSAGSAIQRWRVIGLNGRQLDALKFRTMRTDGGGSLAANPVLLDILGATHEILEDPVSCALGSTCGVTALTN